MLARQDLGEVALAALDELAKGEEDARPRGERRAAPRSRGLGRGGDRRIDGGGIGEGNARARFAARGIVDVAPAVDRAVPRFAGYPMRDG